MRMPFTITEDALLRCAYPTTPTADIAAQLGRTIGSVYQRAQHLGLRKSAEYLASAASGRLQGQHGLASRFQKGHIPRNKGLRRPGYSEGRGRMQETQFKQGEAPHTWVPIGTERLRDGYWWIKVRDDLIPARRNWLSKHQYVYEQAHGPIPAGHLVRFKDNDRTNLALANLECVSRAEHVQTRGLHALPPEIVKVHQLRGAIMRQINKRQPPPPKRRTGRPPKRAAA